MVGKMLYNLILQDSVIEDLPLDDAMDIAMIYAEAEASSGKDIQPYNFLPFGYSYRVGSVTVATIELAEEKV